LQNKLKEMFGELSAFELEIRIFIANTLTKNYSHNWIKQAIPKALRNDWKGKKDKDVKEGRIPEQNLINYADFSHYKDIILSNWKIFSQYFGDKEKLRVRLDDLNNLCRIVTMHNRFLTEDEIGMGKVSIRWLKSKMEATSRGEKKGTKEIKDIQPIFRANPFMIEEGARFLRGEKHPSKESLKRIDMQLVDSSGTPLFAEIKWTGIDKNQVREYRKVISSHFKKYRLMWVIPDDLASEAPRLKKLGVEVKIFSKKNMTELVRIRKTATAVLVEIKELMMKPFGYTIQNAEVTFEDVIRACYFDGSLEVDGRLKRVGLKQSAIGRYLDLVHSITSSPKASSLPELTLECIWEILAAPYCYKSGKFWAIARKGLPSIAKSAHIHSSLSNIINQVWKCTNDFHMRYKNEIRTLYGDDARKYDLTFRIIEEIAAEKGQMLNVKTLVTCLIEKLLLAPLRPTPKIFHTTLNQWVNNSVDTSGYENDFAKRIIEIATLKRILVPQRGITIMWVLAPKYQNGNLIADRVPCQSFIFNRDHTLYLEVA